MRSHLRYRLAGWGLRLGLLAALRPAPGVSQDASRGVGGLIGGLTGAARQATSDCPIPNACVSFYGARFGGTYLREKDGTLRLVEQVDGEWQVVQSAGPLRAAEVDAFPRSGGPPDGSAKLSQSWSGFQGLVPDDRVKPPLEWKPLDVSGKRVVVVLSEGTLRSLARLDSMRLMVGAWAETKGQEHVQWTASNLNTWFPRRSLARTVSTSLGRRFAEVSYSDDLSGFGASTADFAFVLDIDFEHDVAALLPILDREMKNPSKSALTGVGDPLRGSVSWVLLDRSLRIVAYQMHATRPLDQHLTREYLDRNATVDFIRPVPAKVTAGLAMTTSELLGLHRRLGRLLAPTAAQAPDLLASPWFPPDK